MSEMKRAVWPWSGFLVILGMAGLALLAIAIVAGRGNRPVPTPQPTPPAGDVAIYGRETWYQARPEPEQSWSGELRERNVPRGPATRPALAYTLVTGDGQWPVYAPNDAQRLAPFVGLPVVVSGKLVDLRAEGFGTELWIASIRPVGP